MAFVWVENILRHHGQPAQNKKRFPDTLKELRKANVQAFLFMVCFFLVGVIYDVALGFK
jgi:hypothetical protein